ncbi:hypothetical protein [Nonomuraea sp. CA-141351]|uniref:hypothetical protein n=1 Tax=Nonomuraea sp. CA-141351 TaxID=3239996 RepID=UPI003D8F05AB
MNALKNGTAVLTVAVLLTAACAAAPTQGQVTHRRYQPPRMWTSTSCAAWKTTTYSIGKNRHTRTTCVARYTNIHRSLPEWYLTLRDGGNEGERVVDQATWRHCPERSVYPACETGDTW